MGRREVIAFRLYVSLVLFAHGIAMLWAGPWPIKLVFVISAAAFGFLQRLAMSQRRWLFRYTDHVYYFLISGAIGVGAIYLTDKQTYSDFIGLFEADALRTELAQNTNLIDRADNYEE